MIEKLTMMSKDNVQENIKKIQQLFPNAITEVLRDGKPTLAVDFDVLKQEMSDTLIDDREERYQMTWPDKKKSVLLANTPIDKTLRPCKEESVNFDTTENLYIEGDNLDVLKLLQETYLGKIKMIYIDPPYNTGNDFVYNDDFAMGSDEYDDISGQYDEQGNRLFQNTESNGRFHTDWLNMIYPRLKIARDLLSDDGVIFISIDDNELDNLLKVMNEIFGSKQYLATFKWNRVKKAPSLSDTVRIKFEYIVVFCKNDSIKLFGKNSYNTQAPLWHLPNRKQVLLFPAKSIRVKKNFSKGSYGGTYQVDLLDDLLCENGFNKNPIRISACSAWGQNKINTYIAQGNTFEIKKEPTTVYTDLKSENNYIAPSDLISDEECGVKTNTDANEYMKTIGIAFDYSKPVSLIKYLLKMVTYETKDSIILDFFSGSATTAHAVMQLNAEDGGNRKFIMVQLPEKCDEKSEAYKAGYKTICDIGKERIRRAGSAIIKPETFFDKPKNVDVGFRVLKLDSSNMKDVYYKPSAYSQNLLDSFENNIKEDRTPLDLLFQVMLEYRSPLSSKIGEKVIYGKQVFIVNDDGEHPDLIACFDKNITENVVKAIAQMHPLYAVFRDSSLPQDSDNSNLDQIFATYSPTTIRKVL